ncbi:hypothetical protein LPB140_04955 [Sphingorhabdus lutea]|uniref:Uncharacterized protein n=1 Tax=Sphingorhabdus lutea TaxID=1913578 RepID=A0A1L3JAW0_9SPHN|nr:hypothetical protein [Sphingorhabdus lutea]APG62258.1 hypothetical protein LPB140_04955 [Sphingorhabdus lutea]
MTPVVKIILITILLFIGFNLFLYGRFRRVMREIKKQAELQADAAEAEARGQIIEGSASIKKASIKEDDA